MPIMATKRRNFNVNSRVDVDLYRQFLLTSTWGENGCPFELEYPFVNIPLMIQDKLVRKHLGI